MLELRLALSRVEGTGRGGIPDRGPGGRSSSGRGRGGEGVLDRGEGDLSFAVEGFVAGGAQ